MMRYNLHKGRPAEGAASTLFWEGEAKLKGRRRVGVSLILSPFSCYPSWQFIVGIATTLAVAKIRKTIITEC
ncbi:hypothetical protein MUK42_34251 [Musa troglodytarum]|uniref:Uncharacterized protein n=1 Tax=Musa troglodytarum TaxID=320322 RepID=A0A9E7GEV5_9LILI|nr:hypothetical protein MUK42_34251 [Musa troglodytarum]